MKPDYYLSDMPLYGAIPPDYKRILEALMVSVEYDLLLMLGYDHEEAYYTATSMAESGSEALH